MSGATTTTTYYLGGLEEVQQVGGTPTLTKYYAQAGLPTAVNVGGTLSYLATDGLDSVSEALSTSGGATAQQLFAPYGAVRYQSGTLPGTLGYTGQHADAAPGLD